MTRIIEAEYHVQTTQFWEVKHIEDWPADEEGEPRDLAKRTTTSGSSGDCCMCKWDKDDPVFEYEPTAEENGDGMDYKWPDAEYIDGERMD